MGRIRQGWELTRTSWGVLRQDRSLIMLPVLSALAGVTIVAATLLTLLWDELPMIRDGRMTDNPFGPGSWIVFAIVSYVLAYLSIFFNVALMCAADERMDGGDPTLSSALSAARDHARAIAPWAAVSVVVQSVIRQIEQRGGIVGQILGTIVGIGWALVTYLILPVIVFEGLGVREAFTRSKDLFRRTWGEMVSGEIGMSLVALGAYLLALPSVLLIAGGGEPEMVVLGAIVAIVWVGLVSAVFSAMNAVFRVALYRYATAGEAPAGFEDVDFAAIFPPRRRRFRS